MHIRIKGFLWILLFLVFAFLSRNSVSRCLFIICAVLTGALVIQDIWLTVISKLKWVKEMKRNRKTISALKHGKTRCVKRSNGHYEVVIVK